MILTVQPARPELRDKIDGTGYELHMACSGHIVQLQIGNVSIAFDGRNVWRNPDNERYYGDVMQFAEYRDCPVRLDDVDCPKCADVAETILFALAADLGYTVSK